MGSSGESTAKAIDASVGGLVWVRRRNGSWWPGRILGPEELPETCSVSPRSGTPVKLLGREDASVDWYNLEKSKRVKAFRCGEYDECIKKAKEAAANSSKKAVKYARREDAIIHALEIESARLGKDHPEVFSQIDKKDGEHHNIEESPTSPNPLEDGEDLDEELSTEDKSNSAQELSQSGVSFEEPNHISSSKEHPAHGTRRRTPNDSEDDGTEGHKRMRGLDDLGMGVVSSLKRKRSQVAHVHEFLKRKNRRRPLTKVLESTAMVSVPIMCEQLPSPTGSILAGVSESKVYGLQSNESRIIFPTILNNDADSISISCGNGTPLNAYGHACDSSLIKCEQEENGLSSNLGLLENGSSNRLFDVPFVAEEKFSTGLSSIVSCTSQKAQGGAGTQSSQSSQVEAISFGNEELNDSGSTSSGTADFHDFSQRMEKGTSKWQLKGKRNSRHTSKSKTKDSGKHVVMSNESNVNTGGVDHGALPLSPGWKVDCGSHASEISTSLLKSRSVAEIQVDELRGWSRNVSPIESHMKEPTAEVLIPQRLLPYRQSRFTVNPKYESSDFSLRHHVADSSLYDVNLEVKASYRPQHVPYISLMSKLNGQPIIGHPLTVEVLDDGFCDNLLPSGSECYSSSNDLDVDDVENYTAMQGVNVVDESRSGSGGRISAKHRTVQPRASPIKSSKTRKNGLLSKKIRKLSSLTGSNKHSEEKKPVVEKLKGPAVACVPVKIVFSRINEALNSSMRPAHRSIRPSNY